MATTASDTAPSATRSVLRRRDFLERVVDRLGRLGLLDRHALDANPGMVGIEDALHPILHLALDARGSVFVQGAFKNVASWGGEKLAAAGGADEPSCS